MATFSVGEAIGSGFRLIRHEPKTMLIWIAAYAALVVAQYGVMWSVMPDMLGYYQAMGRGMDGSEAGQAEALALASRMMAFAPIMFLVGLVVIAVMQGAIFRAVLHPEDRRFAYLRFGRGELWLLLSTLLVWIVIVVVYVVLVLLAGVIGGVAGVALSAADPAAAAVPIVVAILACVLLTLLVALRLSLALPMSHDQQRLVVFEGWRLTKGASLKLLLTGIALVAIVILVEVLIFALLGIVLIVASGLGSLQAAFEAPTAELASRLVLWIPVIAVLFAAFGVAMYTIMIAPLADIYRQLTASAAPAPPA